jgi:hypothetical protein
MKEMISGRSMELSILQLNGSYSMHSQGVSPLCQAKQRTKKMMISDVSTDFVGSH